jgi:hypothetical protein
MLKSSVIVVVLLTLSPAAGCTVRVRPKAVTRTPPALALTPQEELAQQAIDLYDQATNLLTSIRDRATATAAAPQLKTIARKLQDLNRRGVPLGSQVNENPQALGRLKQDLEKAIQRYADAAVRQLAQDNLLGPAFQEALRELGKLPQ